MVLIIAYNSGSSVSLSGDGTIVAIGAPYNDGTNGNNSGHVRLYQYTSNNWTQIGNDIDGENANNFSGYSICLSNDSSTIAIGAIYNNSTGHTRIYNIITNATNK